MSDNVFWILELNIKDGKGDEFKSLMEEMVSATKADEPNALHYEWFVDGEAKRCTIHERYADNAAVLAHLGNFGSKFAERFMGCVEATGFTVYGRPNDEVKKALDGFSPTYMTPWGGFAR